MKTVSIVVPVYKSSTSLEIIIEQIRELEIESSYEFEVIFVNDSPSFSETSKTLQKLASSFSQVSVLTLRKSVGQHIALLAGMKQAKGDFIITMDDDLQHPVKEIPKLLNAINGNGKPDAVFAIPGYLNKQHNIWRNAGSYLLNSIDSLFLEKPKNLQKSPFRIMTKDIKDVILKNHNAMPSISSLIINATESIINIKVKHHPREYGRSNYTFRKLLSHTFNNVVHYSSLPLKILGFMGFMGFLFSAGFILYTLINKFFFGISFPGYASTVILISFFGGLNLLAIGIIGEYLIRIIKEQQKWNLNDLVKNIE